jgi:hypothetical protein
MVHQSDSAWNRVRAELGAAWPFVVLVFFLSLFRYVHTLGKLMVDSPFIDFAHYYTYATVVAQGYNPFDPSAVAHVDSLLAIRRAGAPANYPPPFYLLMRPWTFLPFRPAAVAWLLASQLFLLGSLVCCRRRLESAPAIRIAMLAFVILNYQPLIEDLTLGQINTALLFLAALAWWGLREGRPWCAAFAVTAAPLLKIQYSLLFVLLWWAGHRRVFARSLLLMALANTAGVLLLGPAHYSAYLQHLFSLPDSFYIWTENLSPRGVLLRLFGLSGVGPIIADGLAALVAVGLMILAGTAIPRSASLVPAAGDWTWALGLTMIPLISPFTEEHHLVILLLPLTFLLLDEGPLTNPVRDQTMLFLSIVLLASAYSLDRFPLFHRGLPALLASGKLLGLGTLAWALVRRLRDQRSTG